MSRRLLVILVGLACGSATCLYSGAGPIPPTPASVQPSWNPILTMVSHIFTIPFPSTGIVGMRTIVLPACLAGALIVIAATRRPANATQATNPAETWLWRSGLAVLLLALISTFVNHSTDWSRGWVLRFAASVGWALLLARCLDRGDCHRALMFLFFVAFGAMALTIAHRADRGLAHFQWPIGPITITAGLAAIWGAVGCVLGALLLRSGKRRVHTVVSVLLAFLSLYVLSQTGRRASALGLVAALLAVAFIGTWLKLRGRAVRAGVIVALLVALTLGVGYVVTQARSPVREKSVSLALRFAYWRISGDLVAARPTLGYGPGTFLLHMTNAVAPLRSESPWIYEGDFDPYAHNEWVQTAVELGLPAGALYLALPLGVVVCAVRRLSKRDLPAGESALAWALIAGLIAIITTDLASVCMRGPIMPVWYFTLIGLLAALCKMPVPASRPLRKTRTGLNTVALVAIALLFALVTAAELVAQAAETRNIVGEDGRAGARLYPEDTLVTAFNAADLALVQAEKDRTDAAISRAVTLWSELYAQIPGYAGVPESYAKALHLAKQAAAAGDVLTRCLREFHSYSLQANLLQARLHESEAVPCVQRALRANEWTPELEAICDRAINSRNKDVLEDFDHKWAEPLARARAIVLNGPGRPIPDNPLELMRIRSRLLWQLDRKAEAINEQQSVADTYQRLEKTVHPLRRAAPAERDAFEQLAKMVYEADHANYNRALAAIEEAERYAVLGIKHESVRNRRPELGFIGGEVIPTEFPASLRPLWRFSSLLHLIAGKDIFLDRRILSSMPMEDWSPANLDRELANLARIAYEDLRQVAPEKRPPQFTRLREMAQQAN